MAAEARTSHCALETGKPIMHDYKKKQGLPDGYTEGGSDTARYKALGNGMAQTCADYVIRRIVECTRAERKENNDG